ncbi:AbiH family protein [Chryseobacterium sp. UNC8MFCol]|uniref:AbiH family protein n=1 Tax=Chryseobacterium sp. UNC8MFCol TaxID=1340435 RepID=UPI0009DE7F91|nr:AbiH family protein [Chryseobacterium sp. UNC8MFCol]
MINRIVLIGNGFDLAHGMQTNYKDFINNYWRNRCEEFEKHTEYIYECDEFLLRSKHYTNHFEIISSFADLYNFAEENDRKFTSKNSFFLKLTQGLNYQGWVDIESEYYSHLKNLSKSKNLDEDYNIDNLNKDFTGIINLLEKYLTSVQENFKVDDLVKNRITGIINHPIKLQDLSEHVIRKIIDENWKLLQSDIETYNGFFKTGYNLSSTTQKIVKDFVQNNTHSRTKEHFTIYMLKNFENFFLSKKPHTTFLNFNYTSTESLYANPETHICHIHGELNNKENPIIFGYGDELDDYYKDIEKLNDNRYLENVKSINYAKTDNYKKILNLINDGYFQVIILGHSCGNSDRTLLNTIFENDNCASIKFFYHQTDETKDNYLDIYKNISRNFNDKTKLRDRVVNKGYSEALIPIDLQNGSKECLR